MAGKGGDGDGRTRAGFGELHHPTPSQGGGEVGGGKRVSNQLPAGERGWRSALRLWVFVELEPLSPALDSSRRVIGLRSGAGGGGSWGASPGWDDPALPRLQGQRREVRVGQGALSWEKASQGHLEASLVVPGG